MNTLSVKADFQNVNMRISVKNIGTYSGKEVIQVYASKPRGNLKKCYQDFVAYKKTGLLAPGEEEVLDISFPTEYLSSYDENRGAFVMELGDYKLRVSRLGNRNDDAEENDKDDSDAGDIGNIRFWNLPIYHDDWRDNLTIELTQEEAFYLDKQIQKSTKGSLLEYVLKNHIDLNEYDDFASLTAELSEKVSEKLAYMMKLACDFNNLVYMARVRYNIMLSEGENTYANDEWSRLLLDIRHNATVNLDAVFEELQLINPRAKSFLCGIQAAFMASDFDMADELIRKRERSLKGAARAKLSRTKEFDHSKWVGGGMLDYRFSNARRIVNDIYAGEVRISVSMLEPDLVIMDEFQRFKFLLSSDDSELGILAHSFLI